MLVKKEIAEERYSICKACPRFTGIKLCSICNCVMPIKVKFAQAICPAGKWQSTDKIQNDNYDIS